MKKSIIYIFLFTIPLYLYSQKITIPTMNDPGYSKQWYLNSKKQLERVTDANINNVRGYYYPSSAAVDLAWTIETGNTSAFENNVSVGIVDGGVNLNSNDELPESRLNGHFYDFSNLSVDSPLEGRNCANFKLGDWYVYNAQVIDYYSRDEISNCTHGNKVLSLIAAEANNGQYTVGVNPYAKFDFFNQIKYSTSVLPYTQEIIHVPIDYLPEPALTEHLFNLGQSNNNVYNMSFSIKDDNTVQSFEAIIDNKPNSLFVLAIGNDGKKINEIDLSWATSLYGKDNTIAVGAIDRNGNVSRFSSKLPFVSVVAPGVDLLLDSGINRKVTSGQDYRRVEEFQENGTSYSAPLVTGVASLLFSLNESTSAKEVKTLIESGADKSKFSSKRISPEHISKLYFTNDYDGLNDGSYDERYGYGILNAHQSLLLSKAVFEEDTNYEYKPESPEDQDNMDDKIMPFNTIMFSPDKTKGLALNRHKMSAYVLPIKNSNSFTNGYQVWNLEPFDGNEIRTLLESEGNTDVEFSDYYAAELKLSKDVIGIVPNRREEDEYNWWDKANFRTYSKLKQLVKVDDYSAQCKKLLSGNSLLCHLPGYKKNQQKKEENAKIAQWFELDNDADILVKRKYKYRDQESIVVDWSTNVTKVDDNERYNRLLEEEFTYTPENILTIGDNFSDNGYFTSPDGEKIAAIVGGRFVIMQEKEIALDDGTLETIWEETNSIFNFDELDYHTYQLEIGVDGKISLQASDDEYLNGNETIHNLHKNDCIYPNGSDINLDWTDDSRMLVVSSADNPFMYINYEDPSNMLLCGFPQSGKSVLNMGEELIYYDLPPSISDKKFNYLFNIDNDGNRIVSVLDYDNKIKVVKEDANGIFSLEEENIINSYNINQ